MKILIALYELENFFGGVQTWSITMYHALKKLGQDVYFFTHSNKINENYKRLPFVRNGDFDLILCNINIVLNDIKNFKGKKVFISHGILSKLAQPINGADIYIAVSEETAHACETTGFHIDKIIRNPIDCDRFFFSSCRKELKTIAFFDRRRIFSFTDELKNYGFEVFEIGYPPILNPEVIIAKADLIVARGRGAYEAMAMGKNVIISGNDSGRSNTELMDGFVDNEMFFKFRRNNLSGRYNRITISSVDIFLKELGKYNNKQGSLNRKLILNHNNSQIIAKQFMELAN